MALGFNEAFKAGISFGKGDMVRAGHQGPRIAETRRSPRNTSSNTTTA